jgi:hypothetical protein
MLDVRGPDFMGHSITWTDDDGEGFSLEIHMFVSDDPSKRASSPGRIRWSYTLHDNGWRPGDESAQLYGAPIFEGDEYETTYLEDDEIVRSLLVFLSLQDGDTDSEYFDSYTERQIAWRDERAETLSLYAMEDDEPDEEFPDAATIAWEEGR